MAQAAPLLLEYCLSDVDLGKAESLRQLAGIQLIPMLSGDLTALQLSGVPRARPLFLAMRLQQEVLVTARNALVACEVGHVDAAHPHKTKVLVMACDVLVACMVGSVPEWAISVGGYSNVWVPHRLHK